MAENEHLDFGHPTRWRASRKVLRDHACTLSEFVGAASEDWEEAVRKLPAALRKGPPLLTLLRAFQGSLLALQETVAAFTERRLASVVLAAAKCDSSGSPERIARNAAEQMVKVVIDQIIVRSRKEKRFCSAEEQATLRSALTAQFSVHVAALSEAIHSSLSGTPVRRIKLQKRPARQRPEDVARMSLLAPRQDQAHVR